MRDKGRRRVSWFKLFLIFAISYFLYVFTNQQMELQTINNEVEMARDKVAEVKKINMKLSEEKVKLNTPAYIEKIAREELGLVKPNEVPYISPKKNNLN